MREITLSPVTLRCCDLLFLGGAYCRLATNSPALACALGSQWRAASDSPVGQFFDAMIHVGGTDGEWPSAMHFRGVEQFVFASFPGASFCFDLRKRQVIGTVSAAVAADRHFWDCVLLPIALGVLGPVLRIAPTHCAALAVGGTGVLIAGLSGAGKSTLTFALARRDVAIVSDDWTYIAADSEGLVGYGLEMPIKLLPDAVQHYPELAALRPGWALNGELSFEVPAGAVGLRMERACRPQLLVFLDRQGGEGCTFTPVSRVYAREFFHRSAERLPAKLAAAAAARFALVEKISELECWRMRYGGKPQYGADALHEFCLEVACPRS